MHYPLHLMVCQELQALTDAAGQGQQGEQNQVDTDLARAYELADEMLLAEDYTEGGRTQLLEALSTSPALPEPLRSSCRTASQVNVRAAFACRSDLTDAEARALAREKSAEFWCEVAGQSADIRMHQAALHSAAGRVTILTALGENHGAPIGVRRRAYAGALSASQRDAPHDIIRNLAYLLQTVADLDDVPAEQVGRHGFALCRLLGEHGKYAVALKLWLNDPRLTGTAITALAAQETWPGNRHGAAFDALTGVVAQQVLARLQEAGDVAAAVDQLAVQVLRSALEVSLEGTTDNADPTVQDRDGTQLPQQGEPVSSQLSWLQAALRVLPADADEHGGLIERVSTVARRLWSNPDLTVQQAADLLAVRNNLPLRDLTASWADTDAVALAQLLHRGERGYLRNLRDLRPRITSDLLTDVLVQYLAGTPGHGTLAPVPPCGKDVVRSAMAYLTREPEDVLLALTWEQLPGLQQQQALAALLHRVHDPRAMVNVSELLEQGQPLKAILATLNGSDR